MIRLFQVVFVLLSFSLSANTIDLSVNNQYIGEHTRVYEDTTAQMRLDDIIRLGNKAFTPVNQEVDSHLFTTSAYWYRFEVSNPEKTPVSRLIVFDIPWLDNININVIGPTGSRSYSQGGDTYPYSVRTLKSNLSNFEHHFEPGISTVYIQIITRDPFVVPISIMDRTGFLEHIAYKSAFIAFIYGILGAMILYNLFLFIGIRTRYYAFYILYIVFFIVMNASYKCYTFEWLFSNNPTLQNWAESTNIYLFIISGLIFVQSFLNLKDSFPRLFLLTNGLILFNISAMFILFFIGYHYHVIFSIVSVMIFSLYAFSIGIYALLKGQRFALFFLLGTSAGLLGSALTALTVMAIIPYKNILFHAVDYGMVIDAILLSLALADKVKSVQKEKMAALTEANTDALTGLLNRRAYQKIADSELNRVKRHDEDFSLILMDIDYFKHVNDTYGHAGGDAVLKTVASILNTTVRNYDYVFRIGGEEFLILLPQTDLNMVMAYAQRISTAIESQTITYQTNQIHITVSMGVSHYKHDHSTIDSMFQEADDRLYRAKEKGRNRIIAEG